MAHITLSEANAWLEPTKLTLSTIDAALEQQVVNLVYGRLANAFDTSSWVNESTTPVLVRTIIAMHYVAWTYDRTYSDDADANAYARLLRQYADVNIQGLIDGNLELIESPTANDDRGKPVFFPTDASSANEPTSDRPSDGGPAFTMGTIW